MCVVENHNFDEEVTISNTEEQLRLVDQQNYMKIIDNSVNDESCKYTVYLTKSFNNI